MSLASEGSDRFDGTRFVIGMRPQLLLNGSDDLSVVQEALGDRNVRTTRIYTTVKVNPRLIAAVRKAFGS